MVRIERGRGTFVNASSCWSPLDPQLLLAQIATGSAENRKEYILSLCETRRCIEVGAAELCAARCTPDELVELHDHLDKMKDHRHESPQSEGQNVKSFATADLAFHRTIMKGTRNGLLASVMQPIEQAIAFSRELTSAESAPRSRAINDHERILSALESRDPSAAALAMRMHIDHTIEDIHQAPDTLTRPD
jgi:DNA-binding FadR family transcriptional regulator